MKSSLNNIGKIKAIDGLRAIAVLAIIFYHVNKSWLPGGFVGVDIFFVISGFVVALSVLNANIDRFMPFTLWFYRRRLTRIYPALIVFLITIIIFSTLFIPSGYASKDIALTGLSAFFGLSNIVLYNFSGDYFGTVSDFNIFTHTWSLGVEEQYYLIFPFIAFVLLVSSRTSKNSYYVVDAAIIIGSVISVALSFWLSYSNPTFAFFMIPTRAWQFAIGFSLASILTRPRGFGIFGCLNIPQLGTSASLLCLAGLIYAVAKTPETDFPFPGAILPSLATAGLLVSAFQNDKNLVSQFLQNRLFTWLGTISYSLYLWHWAVIVVLRWTVGENSIPQEAAALGLTLGLSAASYYLVERPVRLSTKVRDMSLRSFYFGFSATLATVFLICGIVLWEKPVLSMSATANTQIWSPNSIPATGKDACSIEIDRSRFESGERFIFSPSKCPKTNQRTFYVLGDSHAGAYRRSLYRLASETGSKVELYTATGCRSLYEIGQTRTQSCNQFIAAALKVFGQEGKSGDVVFLPSLYIKRYREFADSPILETSSLDLNILPSDENIARGDFEKFTPLISKGMAILVELPGPVLKSALFRCADWYTKTSPYCEIEPPTRNDLELRRSRAVAYLSSIAKISDHVTLWDPFPLLCPQPICDGYKDGKPLFNDTDHISGFGNDVVYPSFAAEIMKQRP
jgi:peptidoglycan/LPS O-acetylase OafA/YrhL